MYEGAVFGWRKDSDVETILISQLLFQRRTLVREPQKRSMEINPTYRCGVDLKRFSSIEALRDNGTIQGLG